MQKRTIVFKTLELTVEYEYFKGEPQEKYSGDLDGYPGSDPSVDIASVYIVVKRNQVPFLSFLEETGLIYKFEEQLLSELNDE